MKQIFNKKPLNEQQVLKKLDIEDFRHLTKNKVIEMFSLIPEMDPEVAKAAIGQFPEFAGTMKQISKEYKEIIEKGLKGNDDSMKGYYESAKIVLNSLDELLKDKDLSNEDKIRIVDQMQNVLKIMGEKDSENKKFNRDIMGMACAVCLAAIGTAGTLLGGKFKFPNNKA